MSNHRSSALAKEEYSTVEEYLAFEREAEAKHEYDDGEIVAMSGASREHNLISGNVFAELRMQLKGKGCESYQNDMRVRVSPTKYYYPDVVIVCDEPQFEDSEVDTLLNPKIIVEVLSKTTESRDKNEKLEAYLALESVTDYLLIAQSKMRVEHYVRQPNSDWLLHISKMPEHKITLASIECELSLEEVYAQVELPPPSNLRSINDAHSEIENLD